MRLATALSCSYHLSMVNPEVSDYDANRVLLFVSENTKDDLFKNADVDDCAAKLNLDVNHVLEAVQHLKGLGLVRTSSYGMRVTMTPAGIEHCQNRRMPPPEPKPPPPWTKDQVIVLGVISTFIVGILTVTFTLALPPLWRKLFGP
jgi:hypothetical protein